MKTSQPKSMSRRPPRPVRVPPPLTRGSERFEGSSVLSEFEGDFGILLWQSLRNVLLWSTTETAKRKNLFSPGSEERRRVKLLSTEVEDSLRAPLAVIARLLADPSGADRRRVTTSCQRIAEWAEERGALATALAFTQAAALTSSGDARLSYAVGRLARQRAEYPRAETWYRRAILLGRQSGDWESYALAFAGLGNLYMQRGSLPSAHKAHVRAYRAARRKGLRGVQGMALHDLLLIAVKRNEVREAEELAASALKAYGPKHRNLPALANDVTLFWMDQGYYAPALVVLEALLPHFPRANGEMVVHGNIATAAAGLQDRERFDRAWQRGWELVSAPESQEHTATVSLTLAQAAVMLEEWERASTAAERALQVATLRQEAGVAASAQELLDALRERTAVPAVEVPAAEPWMADHAGTLATTFARSLNAGLAVQ
ncbi:MAG TPA: hypothetical protein VF263_03390 [Longimicrobiaceae bacterium]